MARTFTTSGYYGGGNTPCDILVMEDCHGFWYCVEGSCNVHFTSDEITLGTDVETVDDSDYFNWKTEINSEEELEAAVEA